MVANVEVATYFQKIPLLKSVSNLRGRVTAPWFNYLLYWGEIETISLLLKAFDFFNTYRYAEGSSI